MAQLSINPANIIENRASTLIRQGYRRISSRYCHLARIDRPDWKEVLAMHMGWRPEQIEPMINSQHGAFQDFYRRVLTKDTITVSRLISVRVPTSGYDSIGYIILERDGK